MVNNTSGLLPDQGKRDLLAELFLRCVLEVKERTLGRDHQLTLTSVNEPE